MKRISDEEIADSVNHFYIDMVLDQNRRLLRCSAQAQLDSCEEEHQSELTRCIAIVLKKKNSEHTRIIREIFERVNNYTESDNPKWLQALKQQYLGEG